MNNARTFITYNISGEPEFYQKMLNWLQQFGIFCLLDSCGYTQTGKTWPVMAAAGFTRIYAGKPGHCFDMLDEAVSSGDWLFGHLGYACKDEVENLHSTHPDPTGFPPLFFFCPEIILLFSETGELSIGSVKEHPNTVFSRIQQTPPAGSGKITAAPPVWQSRFSKAEYLQAVEKLKQHILRGDCYEANFCQEFFAEQVELDPLQAYRALTDYSPNPFSAFYRLNERYLVCASPERFLQKKGNRLLSQPIKGTRKRQGCDITERSELAANAKERSENIMVADLVRNDLSRVCESGSVKAVELCQPYTFPHVHHLVSTITGIVRPGLPASTLFRALFPMGSMTGAPKKRVMELVEEYEKTARGIFSGAVGYFTPEMDFDFNVVIRSMIYNRTIQYLSFPAGSGITFYCDAEKEYAECLLKASAIQKILETV